MVYVTISIKKDSQSTTTKYIDDQDALKVGSKGARLQNLFSHICGILLMVSTSAPPNIIEAKEPNHNRNIISFKL